MSDAASPNPPTAPALPVGRLLLLAGAGIALVSSFLTWFWGGKPGEVTYEIAWGGEESLFAVLCAVVGGIAGLVGAVKRSRSAALAFVGLAGGLGCVVLALIFVNYNSETLVVFGETIPTGIGAGAYVGIVGGALMSLGGLLEVLRALKR